MKLLSAIFAALVLPANTTNQSLLGNKVNHVKTQITFQNSRMIRNYSIIDGKRSDGFVHTNEANILWYIMV